MGMKTFTLKTRFIRMHMLCLLLSVFLQDATAQVNVEKAHFRGKGMDIRDVVLGGVTSSDATRIMLYNVGQDMFLDAGGYWGTRTTTYTVGLPLVLRQPSAGRYIIQGPFSGDLGQIVGLVLDQNITKRGVFFDRSPNSSDCYWQFEEVKERSTDDDKVYQIKISASDNTEYKLCSNNPMTIAIYNGGNNNLVKALTEEEIKDKDSGNKENTYWKIVSDKQMIDLFDDTYTNETPANATFLLRAQNFNRNNMYVNYNYGRGWRKSGNIDYKTDFTGNVFNSDGEDCVEYENYVAPVFGMFYCADLKKGQAGAKLYQTVTISRSGWYKIECQGLYNDKDGTREPYAKLYARFDDAAEEFTSGWASVPLLKKSYGETEERLSRVDYNEETFKCFYDDYGEEHTFLADGISDNKISNKFEAAVAFYTGIYPNSVMVYANIPEGKTKELELGIEVTENMADDEYIYIDNFQLKYLGTSFTLNDEWTDFRWGSKAGDNVSEDYGHTYQNNVLILKRALANGKWHSICLPVNLTAQQLRETFSSSVKLAKLSDPISDTYNCIEFRLVDLNKANESDIVMRAGECYIIKPGAGNLMTNGEIQIGDMGNATIKAPYYVIPRVSLNKKEFATDILNMTTGSENFTEIPGLAYNEDGTFEQGRTYSVNGTECRLKVYATFENNATAPAGAYNFFEGNLYHFKNPNRLEGYSWWIVDEHPGGKLANHTLSFRASLNGISDNTATAIEGMTEDCNSHEASQTVYNVYGQAVRRGTTSLAGLPGGLYIVNGKKTFIK